MQRTRLPRGSTLAHRALAEDAAAAPSGEVAAPAGPAPDTAQLQQALEQVKLKDGRGVLDGEGAAPREGAPVGGGNDPSSLRCEWGLAASAPAAATAGAAQRWG